MAGSAVRFLACAGMVAAGLLIGGGIASADTGLGGHGFGGEKNNDSKPRNDPDQTPFRPPVVRIGAREDRGGFEVGPGGIRIPSQPGFRVGLDVGSDGPRPTIDERGISGAFNLGPRGVRVMFGPGSGGSSADIAASGQGSTEKLRASEGAATAPAIGRAAMAQRLTIYLPFSRQAARTGARPLSSFTTVVISVSTGSILRAFGWPQPHPEPTPSPSFRTSEPPSEKPDVEVIDSSGEGGSDYAAAGEPQPVRAPLVVAPPPVAPPPPVVPPVAPPAIPPIPVAPPPAAGRPGGQLHVPSSIVAGAPPGIREPAPTAAPPPAAGAGPVEVPPTRLGYQQYLRTAKVGDMAVVAVPGAIGLLFLTFSGGFIGYRQANSVRFIRAERAQRFLR